MAENSSKASTSAGRHCTVATDEISDMDFLRPILQDTSVTLVKDPSLLRPREPSYTPDTLSILKRASESIANQPTDETYINFARFVEYELRQIKNVKRLIEVKEKIREILLVAKSEEVKEREHCHTPVPSNTITPNNVTPVDSSASVDPKS
ncbi:uncharacterized protein LOC142333980 [Lycorma delicatula]|uniref:uncharacterized protein LOC142333980 n=1 Tax=Lycorma delicatula TaxID=130591 RepID=UPI003F50DAB4